MTRNEVLARAAVAVSERADNYRAPRRNFEVIAALWSTILGVTITPAQVALCMGALKIARLMANPAHEDSWVDLAGYAACGAEVATTGGAP